MSTNYINLRVEYKRKKKKTTLKILNHQDTHPKISKHKKIKG